MNFLRALLRLFHRPIRVSKRISYFCEPQDYRDSLARFRNEMGRRCG